jgi:hypothetical protein
MPLAIPIMNPNRSGYSKSGRPVNAPAGGGDPYLFWWTIVIFIMLGLATFSWFFSLYVFNHPEKPKNYRLLTKFKKIEPLTAFSERTAPKGKFFSPKEIYGKFFNYTDIELEAQNAIYKRGYIQNFYDLSPTYLKGKFIIYKTEELGPTSTFPSGLVVRAKDPEFPNVSVEFIFPSEALPKTRMSYGEQITVTTNDLFACLLHISRLPEDSLCFTVVPLNAAHRYVQENQETIAIQPPELLNMAGAWPITDESLGDRESAPPPAATGGDAFGMKVEKGK